MKKILILGSGLVVHPIIRYLLSRGYHVTVASNTPDRAVELIEGHPNGQAISWDAGDEVSLSKLVASHDLVVSLLPYVFHVDVARMCIHHRKNLVTSSYVKPEMRALDQLAKEAGVILLNELGLDPGIDHMSAMHIIDQIHQKEGAVLEFYSFCGALPAPEAANNPFGYRFSWSPKGVIMAGNNDGLFLRGGKVVTLPSVDLFKNPFLIECPVAGNLEVYPNRDSLAYKEIYGIPEAQTLFRGTFRNQGWCEILDSMKQFNLFSYDPLDTRGMTYADFMEHQRREAQKRTDSGIQSDNGKTNLLLDPESRTYRALQWVGLFDDTLINRGMVSPFDVVSDLMIDKMTLTSEERDMIVMQHTFLAAYSDGRKEVIRSRMLDFGIPGGDTAVARTVALPAAIGVEMILTGKITVTGVHIPVIPEIYTPVLRQLETMGIKMVEEYGLPLSENISW